MSNNLILVIDDESVTRRLVTHALKSIQIATLPAANGKEALELARNNNIELALVDINLPDIDGFTLIQQLKEIPHVADIPMVLFTARNNPDDAALAEHYGAVGFLYKPFSTTELRELIKKNLV